MPGTNASQITHNQIPMEDSRKLTIDSFKENIQHLNSQNTYLANSIAKGELIFQDMK